MFGINRRKSLLPRGLGGQQLQGHQQTLHTFRNWRPTFKWPGTILDSIALIMDTVASCSEVSSLLGGTHVLGYLL